jgi:hypothetical protein
MDFFAPFAFSFLLSGPHRLVVIVYFHCNEIMGWGAKTLHSYTIEQLLILILQIKPKFRAKSKPIAMGQDRRHKEPSQAGVTMINSDKHGDQTKCRGKSNQVQCGWTYGLTV